MMELLKSDDLLVEPDEPLDDEALMQRAVRVIRNLTDYFGVTPQWSIMVCIEDGEEGATHAARVAWPTLYKKASIMLNRKSMNKLCDREFVQYLAHEVIHLVVAPLDDMLKEEVGTKSYVWMRYCDIREGVVDSMTNVFMKAWEGGEVTFYTRTVKGEA